MRGEELHELVGRLWAAHGAEDIAGTLRERARRLVGADGITLVLREGELCHYVDEDAIGPLWKGRRFPMAACISGWAMRNRRQAMVPDVLKDERIPQDAYRPTFVKSLVMTPILMREPVGALGAYWSSRREPHEAELGALQALADAAALALARPAEKRRSRPHLLIAAMASVAAQLRAALAEIASVRIADAFETAITSFRDAAPDLVIVGYHFDGGRPDRVVRALRELDGEVPVLLVRVLPYAAGRARDADMRQSYRQLGVDEYLVLDETTVPRGEAGHRAALLAAVKALLA